MELQLLQEITEAAQELETITEKLEINLSAFPDQTVVCETAEEFLMQVYAKILSQGLYSEQEVARVAPILATLQLLTKEDTRETILAKFKGDSQTNLITISRKVNKPSSAVDDIDRVLFQIGRSNGRPLMDKIAAVLNDPQSSGREALASDVQKLASWYRRYATRPGNSQVLRTANQQPSMNQPVSMGA